jgi:hypothetical protein
LFLWEGLVIAFPRLFRSPCIPLWTSVEDRVLEIVGLDSESGLKMGDILEKDAELIEGLRQPTRFSVEPSWLESWKRES